MAMQYNKCDTCGAKDGRAGMLFQLKDGPAECWNCYKTRQTGDVCIDITLRRSPEELQKTMAILDGEKKNG